MLTINGGSSSIKFAAFSIAGNLQRLLMGKIERIGQANSQLVLRQPGVPQRTQSVTAPDHKAAVEILMQWIDENIASDRLVAAGHRVVHGGPEYRAHQRISPQLVKALRSLEPFDPEHLPDEIRLTEAFHSRHPNLPQVACFDTAFHRDLPLRARMLPIPRRFHDRGIQRYGFHGLSYAFIVEQLGRVAGPAAAEGRSILAHLGNGASLAAVHNGRAIDTTMGFTPAAGVPMSTRSGDLDPGLPWFLSRTERMSASRWNKMVNSESGLLGISETSSDMRELLERESSDHRAAEAVQVFCYSIRKAIGALAAALGGLDTIVFTGGIGENSHPVRARICEGMGFLGMEVDLPRNQQNAPVISSNASRVTIRVIPTDEEWMIARSVCEVLGMPVEASYHEIETQ
ncbi:MAG TPA: acetate/propionate family kinase [Verrucomicrobiae bacterium]|nr:acetate/propionate family kinase [Verrucomicrobiae bacterium]